MTRRLAVRVLCELDRDPQVFAAEAMASAMEQEKLNRKERGFLHELVFGVLRRRRTLDSILAAYSKMPLKDLERAVHQALRLGIYQLLYLDGVPAFAAIHETVQSCKAQPRSRAFMNGVLRTFDRECRRVPKEKDRGGASAQKRLDILGRKVAFFSRPVFADPQTDLETYLGEVTSHPTELARRWLDRWGRETALETLEQGNRLPPLSARVNSLRGSREQALERLRHDQLRCREGGLPCAIRVEAPPTELVRSKSFQSGGLTVQDETAMKVAAALQPKPDQRLLDLCAAPGGKTTHLAELSNDEGTIVALDRDDQRLDRLRESMARLQLRSIKPLAWDASQPEPLPADLPPIYDGVLLDAPCTNTGVLARRPEARFRFDEASLASLTELQRRLLERAADWVAPGGCLVYSTCSLEPEENLDRVLAFQQTHPQFALEISEETLPSVDGDGGFFARLRRSES